MTKIVTWKVKITVPTGCPDFKPDPYTGQLPAYHCAVAHFKKETLNKSAEFESQEDAELFIKNSPSSCSDFKISDKN